jgi:ribosomal protein S18 acetylase RimI-like enzyme
MAELHMQGYAGDFLPSFGSRFLVAFYDVMLKAKAAIGFVGMENGEIVGFCMFTPDIPHLFGAILKRGFFKLGLLAGLRILQQPSLLKKVFEAFRYNSKARLGEIRAEMILWSVDPRFHGHGLGTALFDVCENEMVKLGLDCYKFTTIVDEKSEATKKAAHNFFRKRGYEWIDEFEFFGRTWHLYRARLPKAEGSIIPSATQK